MKGGVKKGELGGGAPESPAIGGRHKGKDGGRAFEITG